MWYKNLFVEYIQSSYIAQDKSLDIYILLWYEFKLRVYAILFSFMLLWYGWHVGYWENGMAHTRKKLCGETQFDINLMKLWFFRMDCVRSLRSSYFNSFISVIICRFIRNENKKGSYPDNLNLCTCTSIKWLHVKITIKHKWHLKSCLLWIIVISSATNTHQRDKSVMRKAKTFK